jgi:hypothetical protein
MAPNRHHDCWMLGDPAKKYYAKQMKVTMNSSKYYCPKSASLQETAKRFLSYQRGLPWYNSCKIDELRRFCKDRFLVQPGQKSLKKADLVELLNDADEAPAFRHFMDLPPELGVLVYTFHFESFYPMQAPAQPPVSRVCRILRKEALPVFYQTCTFRMCLHLDSGDCKCHSLNDHCFYKRIPENHLRMIKKIDFTILIRFAMFSQYRVTWSVDFRKVEQVVDDPQYASWVRRYEPPLISSITAKLTDFVRALDSRDAGRGLFRSDVAQCRELIRDGVLERNS